MATAAPIKLTTLAALKAAIDEPADSTSIDTYLQRVIAAVSAAIINWLGRECLAGTYTETFDIEPGQRRFFLRAYPVTSVTSVKVDYNRSFGADTALDSTEYLLRSSRGGAWVEFLFEAVPDVAVVQITCVGGMGATTAEFISGFPEVEAACQIWCAAIVKKRTSGPLQESVSGMGTTVTKAELVMPTEVKQLLQPLRRMGWGSQ